MPSTIQNKRHKNGNTDDNAFKENILILLLASQIYNLLQPIIGKGPILPIIFTDTIQNSALSTLFIASTFLLATNTKPSDRRKRIVWGLALALFAFGFFVVVAKIWLGDGSATTLEPPEHY
jgi:uncharacterized membrane protein YfcA